MKTQFVQKNDIKNYHTMVSRSTIFNASSTYLSWKDCQETKKDRTPPSTGYIASYTRTSKLMLNFNSIANSFSNYQIKYSIP